MPENKAGCRVELELNCHDENGVRISDIPQGSWFGMDRYTANCLANDIVEAVLGVSRKYNELGFGVNGLNPSPSAALIANQGKGQPPKR